MFKQKENIINLILSAVIVVIILAIVIKNITYNAGERFDWSAGVYTQKGNIVQVANCTFFNKDWSNYSIDAEKIIKNEKEDINYAESSVDNKFYPDSLDITWYSYEDQKFYEGKFQLSHKKILKIAQLLRTTTTNYSIEYARANPNKIRLYFFANIKPNGKVDVVISDLDKYLIVDNYQAKETVKTWGIFKERYNRDDQKDTVNVNTRTALVIEKHPYILAIQGLPNSLSPQLLEVKYFNQDKSEFKEDKIPHSTNQENIPEYLDFTWGTPKKSFSINWRFEGEQILTAFKKLEQISNNNQIVLNVVVNANNDKISISLSKGDSKIELKSLYSTEIEERNNIND